MTLRAWRTTSLGRLRWSPSTPSPPPSPYLRLVSWGSSGRLSPLTVTEVLRGLGITVCTVTGYVVGSAAFLPVCSIWFGTICSIFLPTVFFSLKINESIYFQAPKEDVVNKNLIIFFQKLDWIWIRLNCCGSATPPYLSSLFSHFSTVVVCSMYV